MNKYDYIFYLRELYQAIDHPPFRLGIMFQSNFLTALNTETASEDLAITVKYQEITMAAIQNRFQTHYNFNWFDLDAWIDSVDYLHNLVDDLDAHFDLEITDTIIHDMTSYLAHKTEIDSEITRAWQLRILSSEEVSRKICLLV